MFASFALSLLVSFLVGGAQAAPTSTPSNIHRIQGEINPGSYIIKVLDNADKETVIDNLQRSLDTQFTLGHNYDSEFFNAFSAILDPSVLNTVASSPGIEYVSEDGIARTTETQKTAPWGLQRISHKGAIPSDSTSKVNDLAFNYYYSPRFGYNVTVYIVDTGINIRHKAFGRRARFGYHAPSYKSAHDGNGHGTHCAGTAVSSLYGVARSAEVVAVKVLSDEGSGSFSDIIGGINWVVKEWKQTRKPAVMSMSLGAFSPDTTETPLDTAVDNAVKQGVHVVVAAGNDNRPADLYTPARVRSAITVGATTIEDSRASFSNYGSAVDIYAPGQDIISTWIGNNTATKNISGTSMATPHVAGVLAALISERGNGTPAKLRQRLLNTADRTQLKVDPELDPAHLEVPIPQVPGARRTAAIGSAATESESDAEVDESNE